MKKALLSVLVATMAMSCSKDPVVVPTPAVTSNAKLVISNNAENDYDRVIYMYSSYYSGYILGDQQVGFINLHAEGQDVLLDKLQVSVTVGSNYSSGNKLIGLVHLYDLDGDDLDYEMLTVTPDGNGTVTFENLDFWIQKQTTSFIVKVEILVPAYAYQNTIIQPSITGNDCNHSVAYSADKVRLTNDVDHKQLVSTYKGSTTSINWLTN